MQPWEWCLVGSACSVSACSLLRRCLPLFVKESSRQVVDSQLQGREWTFLTQEVAGGMERERDHRSNFTVPLSDLYLCKSHVFPLSLKLLICKVGVNINPTSWGSGIFSDLLSTYWPSAVLNITGKKALLS